MEKISRRSFIKSTGLGLTFLASSAYSNPLSSLILSNKEQNSIKLDYVIFDKGSKKSEEFAHKMSILGTKSYGIEKDIYEMYRDIIKPTWKNQNSAIAGLTSYETLFVLQRFAFDNQMQVYFNIEHSIDDSYTNNKLNLANEKLENDLKKYNLTDALALNLSSYPQKKIIANKNIVSYSSDFSHSEILYSWIIAAKKLDKGELNV